MKGCPVLECALELLKIQKFGHVFYSVFVRILFTLSMVKEYMDPVTCMLPVMLLILLEPACPVFILRFVLLFSLVGALTVMHIDDKAEAIRYAVPQGDLLKDFHCGWRTQYYS